MIIEKKAANAVGGKTARACDGCLRRRARWYCTADDAFLCQTCDSSVHSANLLASRHERVRLNKRPNPKHAGSTSIEPAWHQGFTRKARTPRPTKPVVKPHKVGQEEKANLINPLALVPEVNSEENSSHEDEDLLLYRVPIFEPFLCDVPNEMENNFSTSVYDEAPELDATQAFDLPSDMDLADFAADVESLLGGGLDYSVPCGISDLGFFDSKEEEYDDCIIEDRKLVKVENDIFNWKCNYVVAVEEEEKVVIGGDGKEEYVERKKLLRLDYEGVISAWDCKGCPWTDGTKPDLNSNDCWPAFMDSSLAGTSKQWIGGQVRCGDVGREAKVTRYREKRRTRLFSKKIRYQVRKINAEKRPRMKGRFVKRSSSSLPSFAAPLRPPFSSYHHLRNK